MLKVDETIINNPGNNPESNREFRIHLLPFKSLYKAPVKNPEITFIVKPKIIEDSYLKTMCKQGLKQQ